MFIAKHQEKQIALSRVPFPAKNLASMLGFMEFIVEDELKEPDDGINTADLRITNPSR